MQKEVLDITTEPRLLEARSTKWMVIAAVVGELDARQQQREKRGGQHDPGRKTQQAVLEPVGELPYRKHSESADAGSEAREKACEETDPDDFASGHHGDI